MSNLENFFRLLVPATDGTPFDTPSVELGVKRWVLTEWMPISEAPPYSCISYSWGTGRTENLLEASRLMSDRTIPAIEATIKASQSPACWESVQFSFARDAMKEAEGQAAALKASQAIWIDAICVPTHEPARSECLRNMGEIYRSAQQVFAVFSKPCSSIFHQLRDTARLDSSAIFILEQDDWITRGWIYQEVANGQHLYFIAQNGESIIVSGLDFLDALTTATNDYRKAHGIDSFTWGEQHPKLESLENLIADYRIAEHAERSAYQVMSVLHQQIVEKADDYFYAMIGALTTLSQDSQDHQILSPSECFMQACEAKGDFSFIYCTAPRSNISGRGWRPVADQLQPVLSGLLASGSGLSGCLNATHLQLKNMCRMPLGRLNSVAQVIGNCLHGNIATTLLERLRQKGFTGCGEYLELENGYFFPQSSSTRSKDIFVVASPDVQWAQGAPALLLRTNGTDINQFCDVGVFIGRLPKDCESINVG
jgi:hypothetical protein